MRMLRIMLLAALQPLAGEGQGLQWTPRIGHEVLVGHVDDDLEQPIILCGLYHGRGEGGVPATPGGQGAEADTSSFASSSDASPSAQGNLSGGNSPAWHGAAPGPAQEGASGQNNAAALSGIKSPFGTLGARLNGTYTLESKQQTGNGDPFVSNLGVFLNDGVVQRWRHSLALDWETICLTTRRGRKYFCWSSLIKRMRST